MNPPCSFRLTPIWSLFLLTFALASPVQADWRNIPYADLAKMPLAVTKADHDHIYTITFKAKPTQGGARLPSGLILRIKTTTKTLPLTLSADGVITLPVRQDWADQKAQIQVNQPVNKVLINAVMTARIPPGTRMSYSKLTESVPVMEKSLQEFAGAASFLAPKIRVFTLTFEPSLTQTVVVVHPDGRRKLWNADDTGKVRLPWKPEWLSAKVELGGPIREVGIEL